MFNGEIKCHLKRRLKKIVLLQVKSLIQIIVKFRTEKKIVLIFIIHHQPSIEKGKKAIEHQFLCSNTMKTNELKVYISLQENKLVCFTNRVHFSNTIWLMISEKSIIVYTFLPYGEWCTDVPKVSINKAYKKNCLLEFQILLALN